ncbi:hypothetical protein AKO1_007684 [Acrasis kona]|uniref:Uncharacterized protein n=1 Tax=Acrasis kona TaxID=1008807 RepID=A0AAW2YPW3_9EUKA
MDIIISCPGNQTVDELKHISPYFSMIGTSSYWLGQTAILIIEIVSSQRGIKRISENVPLRKWLVNISVSMQGVGQLFLGVSTFSGLISQYNFDCSEKSNEATIVAFFFLYLGYIVGVVGLFLYGIAHYKISTAVFDVVRPFTGYDSDDTTAQVPEEDLSISSVNSEIIGTPKPC